MTGIASLDSAHAAARREGRLVGLAVAISVGLGFGVTLLIYAPVLWLGILSFSDDPLAGLPGGPTLRWYRALFANPAWVSPLLRSLMIAAIVALLCMIAATLVGRVLPRMRRHRGVLLAGFMLPLVVPGIVIGIDIFIAYRMLLGVRMGLWSLVLSHFVWAFPFALLGMLVVSSRFDVRLLEAASDLGASGWQRFLDIELPLLMPGVSTAGLFGFLLSMTELPRSIFVAGHRQTLPLYTWAETTSRGSQVPLLYSLNALIAAVSIALSVLAVWLLTRKART